jgi:glucose/arabinose dehydrogenase
MGVYEIVRGKGKTAMKRMLMAALLAATSSALAYEFNYETIVSGVDHPTALVFINQTTALLTERNGGLRYLRDGKLDGERINAVPQVYVAGQAGLFDVLPDPDFAANRQIYLSFSQGSPDNNTLKIARATLNEYELDDLQIIFAAQPLRATAFHYGGRMIFLPDGTLLFTCGDGFEYRERAQSLDSHFGKVLRINTDGSVPADNPYVANSGVQSEIYSYGHRNLQGLVLGSDGQIYSHEHGPRGGDELNLIEPTKNYGWPAITYGVDYSGAHVSPYSSYAGMEQPLLHWTPSIAPGGMTQYRGQEFSTWQGSLLVAALAEKSVRRVVVDGRDVLHQEILFADIGKRMRDVRVGPGGEIYLLTDADDAQVIKVTAVN